MHFNELFESVTEAAFPAYGNIGVVVPPANPTVEWEFGTALRAEGLGVVASRLPGTVSRETGIGLRERFVGYNEYLAGRPGLFGGMELSGAVYACTGANYLAGHAAEDDLIASLAESLRCPVTSSSLAVRSELEKLGAASLSLITPYPEWLSELARRYYEDAGFAVAEVVAVPDVVSIYSASSAQLVRAFGALSPTAHTDAVVVSGTGLASLRMLRLCSELAGRPVISSNGASVGWVLDTVFAGAGTPGQPGPGVTR